MRLIYIKGAPAMVLTKDIAGIVVPELRQVLGRDAVTVKHLKENQGKYPLHKLAEFMAGIEKHFK